jgi:3-hydroxy-3-methylglutaryl CoA synthase
MSKVEAYRCDKCQKIKLAKQIVAVSKQQDLFDSMRSYPTKYTLMDRYDTHYCTSCYQKHVIQLAESLFSKKKQPEQYDLKVLELAFHLKKQCITATRESK